MHYHCNEGFYAGRLDFFRHLITYFAAKNAILLDIQFIDTLGKAGVFFTPSCDSTQLEIQRFIRAGAMGLVDRCNPLVLFTNYQTDGVGQRGSTWESAMGENLLLTLAVTLDKSLESNLIGINKSLVAHLVNYLSHKLEQKVYIKWPNDIINNDLKLGGILLETTQIGPNKYLLMGLGVNVKQREFPIELTATSMSLSAPNLANLEIRSLVFGAIESLLKGIEEVDTGLNLYQSYLYRKHEWIDFLNAAENSVFRAKLLDVNEHGQVVVELEDGFINQFHHGQVRMMYRKKSIL